MSLSFLSQLGRYICFFSLIRYDLVKSTLWRHCLEHRWSLDFSAHKSSRSPRSADTSYEVTWPMASSAFCSLQAATPTLSRLLVIVFPGLRDGERHTVESGTDMLWRFVVWLHLCPVDTGFLVVVKLQIVKTQVLFSRTRHVHHYIFEISFLVSELPPALPPGRKHQLSEHGFSWSQMLAFWLGCLVWKCFCLAELTRKQWMKRIKLYTIPVILAF